jgi:hypothetical protein
VSVPPSKRREIWLHNIKGELEYEQNVQLVRAMEGKHVDSSPIQWGPRMRAELEKDPDAILDWLCEIGVVRVAGSETGSTTYERVQEWKPGS